MSNTEFKSGDLVRFTERNVTNKSHVHFARVFRVHQSWLEFHPGSFGALKVDCELVNRPRENNEDFGLVALPESQLRSLWHLAVVSNEESAGALEAELERIENLPWRKADCG